ncbi:Daunorubicin C-13 ketoreductase [Pyrenophora teres f. maculata]|nr:Daunorubicin C-13 ketoreductase [Pyrenophora teres f. maculata]
MARFFITGSSDGLGAATAKALIAKGHSVVLHARNDARAKDAREAVPGAEAVVIGDLSSLAETKALAEAVNKLGTFDCVIHNAAICMGPYQETVDGIPAIVAINSVAPYVLSVLIKRPKRLVFVTSGMHEFGTSSLTDIFWKLRPAGLYEQFSAYGSSKFLLMLLMKAFARMWPDTVSTSLEPGHVPTKMGGPSGTDSMEAAVDLYLSLAEGEDEIFKKSGSYFYVGMGELPVFKAVEDVKDQDKLIEIFADFTGVKPQ